MSSTRGVCERGFAPPAGRSCSAAPGPAQELRVESEVSNDVFPKGFDFRKKYFLSHTQGLIHTHTHTRARAQYLI